MRTRYHRIGWLIGVLALAVTAAKPAVAGSFVNETAGEFLSSGDFNGDGRLDVVVLDKLSGNARVGYQDDGGAIVWSGLFQTGVAQPTGFTVGRFFSSNMDAIAVTSISDGRVHMVSLASPSNAPLPRVMTPNAIGPYAIVGLMAPYGTSSALDSLAVASIYSANYGDLLVELYALNADGLAAYQDAFAAEARLSSPNAMTLAESGKTYVAAMLRGSNDTFAAFGYAEQSNILYRVNLAPGTEYSFGYFRWGQDTERSPTLFFYVPGESNIIAQRVVPVSGGFDLSTPAVTSFTSAVDHMFYIDEGTNGVGVVRFGDGVAGVRLDSSGELKVSFGLGLGAVGNVINAAVPLGPGKFALLLGDSNSLISAQARVFSQSGSTYAQSSSADLPAATSSGTRANVWLFANDPFVSSNPAFVASIHAGDWITSLSGLPGSVSVVAETDRGVTNGLGDAAPQTLASPSLNASYGVPNQYHATISLFTYSGPRSAEPVLITISPPPGHYENAVSVSFSTRNLSDRVYVRFGPSGAYQQYSAPLLLVTNAEIQFYGVTGGGARSALQLASYTFTAPAPVLSTNLNGSATNAPPGSGPTNDIATYAWGTVVYGRRSGTVGTIWAIHLDGSGDRYITDGVRPRVSPDGRYLAFMREGSPFQNLGNLWIRDLSTGDERRLYANNDTMVYFDWDRLSRGLIFDYFCKLWRVDLDGVVTPLPMVNDCSDDAPIQSPVDARLAFHNLGQNASLRGIYVAPSGGASKQRLTLPPSLPRFPAWSPDGQLLAFADGATASFEGGRNLWIANPDGAQPHQITAFTGTNWFPFGAVWSPAGDSLIGAATLNGLNGIWVVMLTADRSACGSPPFRLPTTPGHPIDIVGSAFAPPPPPALLIRSEPDHIAVTWPLAAWGSLLESVPSLDAAGAWTTIPQPYILTNGWFEHRIALPLAPSSAFFRLRQP